MGLRNCERCGRLFAGVEPVCPACAALEHDEFVKVREYLRGHRTAPATEVSNATGVSVQRIHQWVRAGRLEMTPAQLDIPLTCERCGAPIEIGRLCPRCLNALATEMRQAAETAAGRLREQAEPPPARPAAEPGAGGKKARVHTAEDVRRRWR